MEQMGTPRTMGTTSPWGNWTGIAQPKEVDGESWQDSSSDSVSSLKKEICRETADTCQ